MPCDHNGHTHTMTIPDVLYVPDLASQAHCQRVGSISVTNDVEEKE